MDLQSIYYKVQYGAFGGLHPSAVADSASATSDAQGEDGVLVDPSAITSANSGCGVPLPNGNLSAGGAPAEALDAGDDDDSAVIDGFFSSDVVASGGSDGIAVPVAASSAESHAHGGSNGGGHQIGGANGGPQLYSKGAGNEAGLPGLISPGASQDVANGGFHAYGGGGDRASFADEAGQDAGHSSRDARDAGVVLPSPAGGNLAEIGRVEEPGVPVVATSVAFATATAPFDHVSFFRDMKLVSRALRWFCRVHALYWPADVG